MTVTGGRDYSGGGPKRQKRMTPKKIERKRQRQSKEKGIRVRVRHGLREAAARCSRSATGCPTRQEPVAHWLESSLGSATSAPSYWRNYFAAYKPYFSPSSSFN